MATILTYLSLTKKKLRCPARWMLVLLSMLLLFVFEEREARASFSWFRSKLTRRAEVMGLLRRVLLLLLLLQLPELARPVVGQSL